MAIFAIKISLVLILHRYHSEEAIWSERFVTNKKQGWNELISWKKNTSNIQYKKLPWKNIKLIWHVVVLIWFTDFCGDYDTKKRTL